MRLGAVASKFASFTFLDGQYNLADIMSKHWDKPTDLDCAQTDPVLPQRYSRALRVSFQ